MIEPHVAPQLDGPVTDLHPELNFKNAWIGDPLLVPPSSALGKLRDICGNCLGLARLALPCGGTPAAILYNRLRIRGGGKDGF